MAIQNLSEVPDKIQIKHNKSFYQYELVITKEDDSGEFEYWKVRYQPTKHLWTDHAFPVFQIQNDKDLLKACNLAVKEVENYNKIKLGK